MELFQRECELVLLFLALVGEELLDDGCGCSGDFTNSSEAHGLLAGLAVLDAQINENEIAKEEQQDG